MHDSARHLNQTPERPDTRITPPVAVVTGTVDIEGAQLANPMVAVSRLLASEAAAFARVDGDDRRLNVEVAVADLDPCTVEQAGRWITADGTSRAYWATDNLVDPSWKGVPPRLVIDRVASAGLQFDPDTGTGVVLHMLSCLAIDGRVGLTAIGITPSHAAELYEAAGAAVASAASWS